MVRVTLTEARQMKAELLAELAGLVDLDVARPPMTRARMAEILSKPGVGGLRTILQKETRARPIRRRYERRMRSLIQRFVDGDLNMAEFHDAGYDITVDAYWEAFGDGRAAGGVDEEVWVYGHEGGIVATQIVWAVHSLTKIEALLGPGYTPADVQEAMRRVPAMASAIEELWYEGLASANDDPMYEWIIGSTREHCRDCLSYHGQRHRLRAWMDAGAVPQSYSLECHGFECQCELQRSRGREVGTLFPPGQN